MIKGLPAMTFPRLDKPAAALLLMLGLAACAENGDSCLDRGQSRRSSAPDAVGVVKDRYLDDATLFLGTPYDFDCGEFASTSRLKSVRDKATGKITHQLMIKRYFVTTGWHYYGHAVALEPEQPLKVSVVERFVGKCERISWMGCQHAEEIAVDLPQGMLIAASNERRRLRISGNDGAVFELWLTPEQVREHQALIAAPPR